MQDAKSIGLKEAEMICDACINKALGAKDNKRDPRHPVSFPIAVCVIDRFGTVLCQKVMDGTISLSARVSRTKAQTALEILRDTKVQREIILGRDIHLRSYEFSSVEHTVIPGGCIIKTSDGKVVGAVGISGRSPDGDEELAQIGVRAFGNSEEFNV